MSDPGEYALAPRPEAVLAVVVRDGRVLMLQRRGNADCWVFPGGKVDVGESPEHAAKRELYEEAGLRCSASFDLGTRLHPSTQKLVAYYLCITEDCEVILMEPSNFDFYSWMTINEIENNGNVSVYPPVKQALQLYTDQMSCGSNQRSRHGAHQ